MILTNVNLPEKSFYKSRAILPKWRLRKRQTYNNSKIYILK